MGAAHILVVCDHDDEPGRRIVLWSNGEYQTWTLPPHAVARPVAAGRDKAAEAGTHSRYHPLSDTRFLSGDIALLDPFLSRAFPVQNTVTAPFRRLSCRGRIFILRRASWNQGDADLARLVALRVGIELENHVVRSRDEAAAARRERAQMARDLHDSILQSLAAASLHLSLGASRSSGEAKKHLDQVRWILSFEAGRIRRIVDETRSGPPAERGSVRIAAELGRLIDGLAQQWACCIALDAGPDDLAVAPSIAAGISHILMEAVSNAVRHGQASEVKVSVQASGSCLVVGIEDNGAGFAWSLEAVGPRAAPVSLSSRVDDMGGTLFVASRKGSTQVRVELPL